MMCSVKVSTLVFQKFRANKQQNRVKIEIMNAQIKNSQIEIQDLQATGCSIFTSALFIHEHFLGVNGLLLTKNQQSYLTHYFWKDKRLSSMPFPINRGSVMKYLLKLRTDAYKYS